MQGYGKWLPSSKIDTERTLLQTNHWLKVHLKLPSDWDKKYERIQLEFDPSCEAMIFETDGTPLQGQCSSW